MVKPKKRPKIVQVNTTHDGRIASVLYDDGRVFVRVYTRETCGNPGAEGFWAELTYPDTKVGTK
jgi:hypothetical protein